MAGKDRSITLRIWRLQALNLLTALRIFRVKLRKLGLGVAIFLLKLPDNAGIR